VPNLFLQTLGFVMNVCFTSENLEFWQRQRVTVRPVLSKKKRKKKTDKNKTRALKSLMHFPGRHFFHTCHNSVLGKLSESWVNTEQGLSISPCMPLLFVDLVLCCLVLINIQHKINFESFETFSESLSSLRDPLHREKLEKVIF
jgi:hypothetical protein